MLRSGKFTWGLMLVEFGWVDTTWQYPQLMAVSFLFDYTFPSFAQKRHCRQQNRIFLQKCRIFLQTFFFVLKFRVEGLRFIGFLLGFRVWRKIQFLWEKFGMDTHCRCKRLGGEPYHIRRMSSIYLLYSTISYWNSLIMGVSSQNMEIVVYVTENDMPIVIPRQGRTIFRNSGQFAASTSWIWWTHQQMEWFAMNPCNVFMSSSMLNLNWRV